MNQLMISKPKYSLDKYIEPLFKSKYYLNKIYNKKIVEIENVIYDKKPSYESVRYLLNKNNIHPKFKNIKNIYIDSHSWERWNERVGPYIEKYDLIELIRQIVLNFPERIVMESESSELASIDGDIIFGYKIKNNTLKINTFYGRKSINNLLHDIDSLRVFNKNQKDKIKLDVNPKLLEKQERPLIPSKYIHFSIVKKENNKNVSIRAFLFNVYSDKDKKVIPYIYFCQSTKSQKKNVKIKDYPLIMKKMNIMPTDVFLCIMFLNLHGTLLMYLQKYNNDPISKELINIFNKEKENNN